MFDVLIFLQRFIWLTWYLQQKSGLTEMVVSSLRFCSSGRSSSQPTQSGFDKVLLTRVLTAATLAWRGSRLERSWEMDEFRLLSWSLVGVVAAQRYKKTKAICANSFMTSWWNVQQNEEQVFEYLSMPYPPVFITTIFPCYSLEDCKSYDITWRCCFKQSYVSTALKQGQWCVIPLSRTRIEVSAESRVWPSCVWISVPNVSPMSVCSKERKTQTWGGPDQHCC